VKPSLTRLQRRMKASGTATLLAVSVVLALVLALTPCCEIGAALAAPAHADNDHHAGGHGDDHDHGMPSTPDSCPAWVDNNQGAIDAVAILPMPTPDHSALRFGVDAPAPDTEVTQLSPTPFLSPPAVPIYLQFAHLLF